MTEPFDADLPASDAPLDPRLARYLRSLPQPLPPPALGDRIVGRHRRQRRRPIMLMAGAIAASLLLLLVQPALRAPGGAPAGPPAAADALDPMLGEIRALDRQLQHAYLDGLPEERLQPLWQARNAAIERLGRATPASRPMQL